MMAGHDVVVLQPGQLGDDRPRRIPAQHPLPNRQHVRSHHRRRGDEPADYDALIQRYAVIASQPEDEVTKVEDLVDTWPGRDRVRRHGRLVGPALSVLVGRHRRHELLQAATPRRAIARVAVATAVIGVAASRPFAAASPRTPSPGVTTSSRSASHHRKAVSGPTARLQIQGGLLSRGTRALIDGGIDTYDRSLAFYADLAERAAAIGPVCGDRSRTRRSPSVVAEPHDNVGMDAVARAIGDAGGATVLLDASNDTSAASLESLQPRLADQGVQRLRGAVRRRGQPRRRSVRRATTSPTGA